MKVEQSPLDGCKVGMHVEATPGEFDDAVQKGVQAYLMTIGSESPESMALEDILQEVSGDSEGAQQTKIDLAVNYLIPRALQQEGVVPICAPDYQAPEHLAADGQLAFDIVVIPKPAYELSDYGSVAIEVDKPAVTDAEIDEQLAYMAKQQGAEGDSKSAPAAIDDDWVRANVPDPDCNTVAQLRQKLRQVGTEYKQGEFDELKINAATAQMAKRLVGDIPLDMIQAMKASMLAELTSRLESEGMTMDALLQDRGMTRESLERDAREQAEVMLREGFTLDAVFRQAGLSLSDADIKAALHAIAPGDEDEAEQSMRASGYMFTVEETAQRLAAGEYLLKHANVKVNE